MERKERNFDRESEKDSGKGEPGDPARQQTGLPEISERGEVECASCEINPEERQQHRNATEERVNKKLRRSAVALLSAPDFDEQERRNEAHLVKQKPENKILS